MIVLEDVIIKYFHTIDHIFESDIKLTNITKNETVNLAISDKSLTLYEINKKLTVARQNGFKYNRKNKPTIK